MKRRMILLPALVLALTVLFLPPKGAYAAEQRNLSRRELYKIMSRNFLACKKYFSIACRYNKAVKSIEDKINSRNDITYYSVFFDMAQAVNDKKTTDDGDYLYGNINEVSCVYMSGRLHFYDVKYYETKAQRKKVNRRVKSVVKKIKAKAKNRYEQILRTYEYVIDHVNYDARRNSYYSAYAGFYKKKTTCNGYAQMMYKILMRMGIPCKFVSGSIKDGKRWYLHAWNMVKIKGKWYNLDACSDDADDGNVYSDYFLKCDKSIKKTHRKDYFYRTKAFKKKYKMSQKDYAVYYPG